MSKVWDRIESLAHGIEDRFNATGDAIVGQHTDQYDWHNNLWTSNKYRRAHVEIVDKRDTHKIYILHCTVFPHYNDPSPIWGFDAVCGPSKITGAFHDFSHAGDPTSPMYLWYKAKVNPLEWNKPRQLPAWAQAIFSPAMVAAGNLQDPTEIDQLCETALATLDFYLANVGIEQQDVATFEMAQNRYCYYQKQNPHVVNSMVAMGIEEDKIKRFVNEILFPESV